jgi:hypothetical protein
MMGDVGERRRKEDMPKLPCLPLQLTLLTREIHSTDGGLMFLAKEKAGAASSPRSPKFISA